VTLYVESSAVLSWLLGEPTQGAVLRHLRAADRAVTSAITPLECARGLVRARHAGRISNTEELAALHILDRTIEGWDILDTNEDVFRRARENFPMEPVRTLDAIHMASILTFHSVVDDLAVMTFDERLRGNIQALGITVVP
jgi:predicted nucleic acid-binding protein